MKGEPVLKALGCSNQLSYRRFVGSQAMLISTRFIGITSSVGIASDMLNTCVSIFNSFLSLSIRVQCLNLVSFLTTGSRTNSG